MRDAHRIWSARHARSTGDRLFLAYTVLLLALVAVAPVVRAIWLSATSAAGAALLDSPSAPGAAVLVTAALWAGALLLGRDRGPALLPPFLAHALGTSELPRTRVLHGPLLRAGALVTALVTLAAALVSAGLASAGAADALGVVLLVLVGALVGAIASVAWLAGQALPRAAAPVALGVLAFGMLAALVPAVRPFAPWGWVGLAYPGGDPASALTSVGALAVLGLALLAFVPALLNRIRLTELVAQAVRWESAAASAAGMELGVAAAGYRGRPYRGRRLRAVRPSHRLWAVFLVRDATGAIRTPGRLVVGVLALAAAGALLALALVPAAPGWLLGAFAGLLAFAGLGPVTDGVRHAASAAAELPLYGVSDGRLLASHALLPLAVVVLLLLASALVCAIITGVPALGPALGALALGPLALLTRIGSALKGPMPPVLLTPIPTPAGDVAAAVRLAWSLDAVLLAATAGASAALAATGSPLPLIGAVAAVAGVGITRWRHRR